ncbi:ribonuclease P complex subunit Pop2 [Westerdykella ornata]|uniref:Ribonuclease P complex subunit Pop2 n=1 Tax=Westerdykella ornata TaxID=318751 RepID=A0A6A6JYG0_WESOR|nr:ribonuclease P complex subunit Pop2 [Westerdykella ornata]KAF2281235.1 ribonuclease P complex subunit Pop2 [Westerdykella ornata]
MSPAMFYDLNIPWSENLGELQRTVAFLYELGYDVIALTHTLAGKVPSDLTPPIPTPLPFPTPPRLRILRRCTLYMHDLGLNNKLLSQLREHYDILAARPTNERTLQQACATLDVDLVSLDLTQRPETHFKFSMLSSALARGVKIELCYSQAITSSDPSAKRTLISNVVQLIRVTRGRGLVFSSEAQSVLGVRAPSDVINLASVWGLGHERGKDGVTKEPRSVVEYARLKRTSYRGVVDVVYGGEKPAAEAGEGKTETKGQKNQGKKPLNKRDADSMEGTPVSQSGGEKDRPISKRQAKRNKKMETAQ